jgi:hypothetical protein
MKCSYFVNLSTTIKMAFHPSKLGKPSMKSMVMASHVPSGTGRGCNSPGYTTLSTLACLHIAFLTIAFIPYQWKFVFGLL